MARINRLKIRKLGNVVPGTELSFGPKGAILLGRNGTGKTTLLNLLVQLCRCDLESLSEEDYDLDFSLTCMNVELNVTVRCERNETAGAEPASKSILDKIGWALGRRADRRELRVEAVQLGSGQRMLIESSDRVTKLTRPDGSALTYTTPPGLDWRILGSNAQPNGQELDFFVAFVELDRLSKSLRRFDEGLDYFRDLTERGPSSACIQGIEQNNYDEYIIGFGSRLISTRTADLLLRDFRKNEGQRPFSGGQSTEAPYLQTFCELVGFEQASISAELDEKQRTRGLELVTLSPLRYSMKRNGSVIHHRHLSFGQARLLAFLHYLDSTPALLMADELVNGMHHEWIAKCIELMHNTQAFLSSQNPLLFDFIPLESAEDVVSRFIICELDEQHRFVWRNMTEADATELYETHKAGLQHTSEILRTRGYW